MLQQISIKLNIINNVPRGSTMHERGSTWHESGSTCMNVAPRYMNVDPLVIKVALHSMNVVPSGMDMDLHCLSKMIHFTVKCLNQ